MATLKELLGIELTEDMKEEDLVNAIQAKLDSVETSDSEKNLKNLISKRNGEIADYKKKTQALEAQLKERMTAEELAEAQRNEKVKELETKVAAYERENKISKSYAGYIGLGFGEELAMSTATALIDGDDETLNANFKTFIDSLVQDTRKATLANAMKNISGPEGGNETKVFTKEDIRKMSGAERLKFYNEHPEEYRQIYSEE